MEQKIGFESLILSKSEPSDLDGSFLENANEIDISIQYGFLPSSIEYCLKYDDIDIFHEFKNFVKMLNGVVDLILMICYLFQEILDL